MKLPWNLTMQINQWWEFTDIGFLFLALIPVVFLFLPYRRYSFAYAIPIALLWELALFVNPKMSALLTQWLSHIDMPLWYALLGCIFLVPIIYFIFCLSQHTFRKIFIINIIFSSFYVFLWAMSAFWIVWYGIIMYFCFFISIGIAAYFISNYGDREEHGEKFENFNVYFYLLCFPI